MTKKKKEKEGLGLWTYITKRMLNNKAVSNYFKNRDPNENMGYNIYNAGPTIKQYIHQQNRVHQRLKYCFIIPLLEIAKKILGKILVTNIPKTNTHKNLRIFSETFDKSIRDWADIFLVQGTNKQGTPWSVKMKTPSVKYRLLLKNIVMTECMKDTADLELLNIFCYNLALRMNKEYPSTAKHLLHTSKSINDAKYFVLKPLVEGTVKIQQVTPKWQKRKQNISTK